MDKDPQLVLVYALDSAEANEDLFVLRLQRRNRNFLFLSKMSGDKYKIQDQNSIYFLTLTIVDWVDLFTRKEYCFVVVESLNYCIKEKNLEVFAYIVMSNHVHLICRVNAPGKMSEFLRDFKKFTSKRFIMVINEIGESRREWLLKKFAFEAHRIRRAINYKIWKDDNHAIEIGDFIDIEEKINYIHENPTKNMVVFNEIDYVFSSAIDYADGKGLVNISKI